MLETVEKILRWTFSWIDRIVVLVMDLVYKLLMNLANLNIVNTEIVEALSKRIGLILGIFMLFNLAINLLNYIVSPDKFADKGKGGSKLILNIIVSLVLLVTYNWIFDTAYKIQYKIVSKQLIPQIIFGTAPQQETQNVEIAYYIYSSMLTINPNVDTEGACEAVYLKGVTNDCDQYLSDRLPSHEQFFAAIKNKDASKLLYSDNVSAKLEEEYIFNYPFIFSTIIGVIVTLILFNFCLDIAKRSVKLYFYQIIAPLPIVANMVPGKGEETFKKWYKSCFSTYLDLFIRLIAIFFAVFLITTLYGTLVDILSEHPFLGIFIILGALMFAKELPQLVQDLTGIKLDGSFTINPLKKIQQAPLAAGAVGYVGARIGGAAANLWGARVQNKNVRKQLAAEGLTKGTDAYNKKFKELNGNTIGGYVGSAIAGSYSAGFRSLWSGITGGGSKSVGQIVSGGITGASLARKRRDSGYNIGSMILDKATSIAQISDDYGTTDMLKGKVKKYQQELDNARQQEANMSRMVADMIREKNRAGQVSRVFDYHTVEDNGKIIGYQEKTYNDYLLEVAKDEYLTRRRADDLDYVGKTEVEKVKLDEKYKEEWNSFTEEQKMEAVEEIKIKTTAIADFSEDEFNQINSAYRTKNAYDMQARDLEKKVKSAQENIAKQNGGK